MRPQPPAPATSASLLSLLLLTSASLLPALLQATHALASSTTQSSRVGPAPSLAYQLWFPWQLLVLVRLTRIAAATAHLFFYPLTKSTFSSCRPVVPQHPLPTLGAFVALNAAFVSIGFVFRVVAAAITPTGLLLALVVATVLVLRKVTSLLAYPGQLALVIRDGEANFARLTRRRLLMLVDAAAELADVLAQDATGAATASTRLRFFQAHQNFAFSVETLLVPTLEALQVVEKVGGKSLEKPNKRTSY